MKKTLSQKYLPSTPTLPRNPSPTPNKKLNSHQQYQTEPSIYQHITKTSSIQSQYKSKIRALQKKLYTVLTLCEQRIYQEKANYWKLVKEEEEIETICLEKRVFWRFAVEELRKIGEFFILRIKERYQQERSKLTAYFHMILTNLQKQLVQNKKLRQKQFSELESLKNHTKASKQELKKFIKQNFKDHTKINKIKGKIQQNCSIFKTKLQQMRVKNNIQLIKANQYFIQIRSKLEKIIEGEKINRQINKESILQYFQKVIQQFNNSRLSGAEDQSSI